MVIQPDGTRVRLPVPAVRVWSVSQVPGGWVVELGGDAERPPELWWVPDRGDPRPLGPLSHPVISADGSLLVASAGYEVVAVALPSLQEVGRVTYEVSDAARPVGIHDGLVLLTGVSGGPGPLGAAVWDLSDGTLAVAEEPAWVWGMSRDGQVLLRVDILDEDNPKTGVDACIAVVSLSRSLQVGPTGLCGPEAQAMYRGTISPNGQWIVLMSRTEELPGAFLLSAHQFTLLSSPLTGDDIRVDLFRTDRATVPSPLLWDTDMTYLTDRGDNGWFRCTVGGPCERLALPTGAAVWPVEAWLVRTYGP